MVIVVTGPENSGSKMCARTIAHVLNVCDFEDWSGYSWIRNKTSKKHSVLHRSTPYAGNNVINVDEIIKDYRDEDLRFVFTTRDGNISKNRIKKNRKNYTDDDAKHFIEENIKIINKVREENIPYTFWSFESTILYEETYLHDLYKFIDVKSEFVPPLFNANKKYIKIND
jgi:hypothetical protein|tara:strand:- start:15361 stop:15870 length:510 start_codon:yes stop_codon:yes gene_type:complete